MTDNNDLNQGPAPEFPTPQNHELGPELDRGLPGLNSQKKKLNPKVIIIGLVVLLGVVLAAMSLPSRKKDSNVSDRAKTVQSNLPPIPDLPARKEAKPPKRASAEVKPPVEVTKETAPPLPPVYMTAGGQAGGKKPLTPEERKLQSSNVAFVAKGNEKSGGALSVQSRVMAANLGGTSASDLAQKTTATKLASSRASLLRERSYMIMAGQFLDCVLETAIDSTVSGMVRAMLSRDVYSTNGKVILLDKGTRLIGQYQRGMRQGEARLFVLWTRAETPNGVIIALDSPGADALGRSGLDGYVDYHFWERFGAAIMFSMLDDLGKYLIDQLNQATSGQNVNINSTGEAAKNTAGIALENSINIPPTLRKNQGDQIMIYVARDLDFSNVYDLEALP